MPVGVAPTGIIAVVSLVCRLIDETVLLSEFDTNNSLDVLAYASPYGVDCVGKYPGVLLTDVGTLVSWAVKKLPIQ